VGSFSILFAIVLLFVVLSGVYHLLRAVWELQMGTNFKSFLVRGMLGIGLFSIAFLVSYIPLSK
jgi:hypothetical protein